MNHFNEWILEIQFSKKSRSHHYKPKDQRDTSRATALRGPRKPVKTRHGQKEDTVRAAGSQRL